MSKIRVGGACLNQTPIDWENNLSNIYEAISEGIKNKVKILCLPELCLTSYGCQDLFLSEWLAEEALLHLNKIVTKCHDIAVTVGIPIRHNHKIYNTTCLIQDKQIKGFYAKQILANDGIHYESRWFSPWPKETVDQIVIEGENHSIGDLTFQVEGIHVGFEICEDAWNEDRPACRLYKKGVDLILNPSASHFSFDKYKTRQELVISSSKSFQCHYLYVNQLGNESGRVIYDGDILIANKGQLLASNERLSYQPCNLMYHDIDISNANDNNSTLLEEVDKNFDFTRASSLALFDYLRKSHTKGYTLSLSGGADSSTLAVLIAELVRNGSNELGFEKFTTKLGLDNGEKFSLSTEEKEKKLVHQILTTAYQGTKNSSDSTFNSAQKLAESIGAHFIHWNIDQVVGSNQSIIEEAIGRKLDWKIDDIALQNIQARSRSPLIWMIANINNSILLTTSNRSEGDVGYTTMDGDTSGSLAPIAGVDKPFILQWLKYAEKELGYSGLKYVNNLTPTAELRPKEYTQSDEDDLMPYAVLLEIEKLAIHKRKSPVQVYQSLLHKQEIEPERLKFYITKFFRMWSINQWKRERLAPSFHLDDFNVDPKTWCRFPILSGGFNEELNKLAAF